MLCGRPVRHLLPGRRPESLVQAAAAIALQIDGDIAETALSQRRDDLVSHAIGGGPGDVLGQQFQPGYVTMDPDAEALEAEILHGILGDLDGLHGDKAVWKIVDNEPASRVARIPIDTVLPRDIDTWDDYDDVHRSFGFSDLDKTSPAAEAEIAVGLQQTFSAAGPILESRVELADQSIEADVARFATEVLSARERARLEAMAFEI